MFRLAIALVVVALAACGGAQRATVRGEDALRGVHIEGNPTIPSSDLVPGLELHRPAELGRAIDPYVLRLDVARIHGQYVRLGFFDVEVHTRIDRKPDGAEVAFVIFEGTRATAAVELIGAPTDDPAVTPDKLRKLIALGDGAPFDYDPYDDAKKTLLAALEDAGYAHAQISATVIADRKAHVATARYIIDAGPRCVFGKIEISGAPGDLEDAVRARVELQPGEPYSASALAKTQRALYEFGRFSTVRVDADKDLAATTIGVKIAVSVGTRHEVKLGGGFGYEPLTYDLRGRAGYSVSGCIDALTTCSLDAQPAVTVDHNFSNVLPKIRLLAGASRMDFLRTYVKGDVEFGLDYLTVEAYTYTGGHARVSLSTPLGVPWLQLRVGWLAALYDFINIDPIVDTGTRTRIGLDTERLGAFQEGVLVDLRDNPAAPTRGAYFEARVAEGTPYAGGSYRYWKLVPEARGYLPLGPFVLAARAAGGEFIGDVPPTERFFSGGASSQRGFNERRLAPTLSGFVDGVFHSVPVGGAAFVETGVELRTPASDLIGIDTGLVLFLDGGDVTDTVAEMDVRDLHWATGLGLRLVTPIGALRFDVGYRLNRLGADQPEPTGFLRPFAVHFGLGEAY